MGTRLAGALGAAVLLAILAPLAGGVAAQSIEAVTPPLPPEVAPPPAPDLGPTVEPPAAVEPTEKRAPRAVAPKETPKPPPPPIVAPLVLRSPSAVLQVLDKVTAETFRFEAPVGRRVRYRNLLIAVKACETRGMDDPAPKSSAYLTIESQGRLGGRSARDDVKQVFHGWMFASAPGIHAVQHPIYDLWLIACSASTPVA